MEKIRLLIVEDDPLARKYLQAILADYSEIDIVGTAQNGKEALELIIEKKPAIALMDYRMENGPGPDKYELVRQAKQSLPYLKIITLTGVTNPYKLSLVHRCGAHSIILKGAHHEKDFLIKVIRETYQGHIKFPEEYNLHHTIYAAENEQKEYEHRLNETQRNIIKWLSQYKETDEIAKDLNIQTGSVRTILSKVRKIEQVETNKELIAYYQKLYPDD